MLLVGDMLFLDSLVLIRFYICQSCIIFQFSLLPVVPYDSSLYANPSLKGCAYLLYLSVGIHVLVDGLVLISCSSIST